MLSPAERRGLVRRHRRRRPGGIDLHLPSGDDARFDLVELAGGIGRGVAGDMDKRPGGANMAFAVERIAFLAVGLIAGIGVVDLVRHAIASLSFPAIEHRLRVGRAVDQADFGEAQRGDDVAVMRVPCADFAADREPLVDAARHLVPGSRIDDAGADIEALVIDPRLLGDADRRHLVHLADIGEFQIPGERLGERVAGDNLALVVLGFGRGITPDHPLLRVDLGDRGVEAHADHRAVEEKEPSGIAPWVP
jgi:hypothetical protein